MMRYNPYEALRKRDTEFRDRNVPRPPQWGGYRLED